MLKVLHTGDWHIGSFPGPEVGGQNARFQDICRCLDFQAMYAEEHRPDLIVVSGDIFHQARVWSDRGLRESRTAIDHIRRLSNLAPTIVLRGTPNHDSEEQFEMLTTAFYGDDSVSVVTEPEVLHIHTYHGQRVDVACIPGFDRGVHRAAHPGLSREEETQVFTDELAKVVLGLKAQCEPGVTSILSTHFTVPGYAEVIRDMDGNVIQLEFIEDTPSVEKSRRLDPRVEVTYFHRDHTENRMRKFRKYKQTVNGKTVYYKEFGDPRIMDPTSGEYVTELEFKSRANEIIEFAIGTATYGKVRWVGSILTVDGARRAESLNNNYFLNGRHTPLLIMVKGGSLTDDSFAKLKEYMNGIRGEAGQHSFMVLETEAADNRTGFNAENRPEVEVKDLAAILQKDELFQDYLENNRRKVQSAFQLPDLYTGYTTDFNRATAQTAMEVTEKQVFQPERRRLAWAINNRLLNCYQFKYVEVFFRAPDVSNPDDLYKLLTVCNNAGGLTPNKAKSVLYKALGETSEDFPEEWGDIPLAFMNAQQRAASTAVAGNSPNVAQNGSSVTGKEHTQPETKLAQNAQQGGPSVEEQLDGQIQKAAAANETELVAVMKEVRRLLVDMKQEEGDAE